VPRTESQGKAFEWKRNERERSVVIVKDKRPHGSGDPSAPLFSPPSQLVALLGNSAHMGLGNLELPVAENLALLVTYPPTRGPTYTVQTS
jgi:hypothetical protein